jgi:hypothetical protein
MDEHNRRTLAVPFRIDTNAVDDAERHSGASQMINCFAMHVE